MPDSNETRDATDPLPDADGTLAQTPGQVAAVAASLGVRSGPVPGYEILGELGRGGMGAVYRARDTRLNREVALKMILRAGADRLTVARFWAEAEVMAAVKHPSVVAVYELGEHDGLPFMAMEFVSGGSLADRLANPGRQSGGGGPLSPRDAADLLAKVASGVGAAHDAGIVHRDLKPANVLLAADGTPKVTDFGIAKRRSHEMTETNAVMGTPAYMAPEQAAARAKFVGPQADVWALGVILYECVSGRRPFDGDTVATLFAQISSVEPPALRTVSRGVPRDLETIIGKCLSKEPEHRYATAAELAADLGRFVRGEPIAARPVGAVERFGRWVRRKPTAAAAWGFSSLAVALALVTFVVFGFWREAEGSRKEAVRLKGIADAGLAVECRLRDLAEVAQANEAKARQAVEREREKLAVFEYGRTIQVAHQEWRDNNIANARALLESTKPELRGWEWRYVHRLCNASRLTLRVKGVAHSVAYSPDGARIVIASDDGAHVWDAKTGHRLLALREHGEVSSAAFSPDGSRVITGSDDRTARVWDARTGAEVLTLKGHANEVNAAAFSPDGKRIVTVSRDGTAKVWDATPLDRAFLPRELAPPPRPVIR